MEQFYQTVGIVIGLFSLITGIVYAVSRVGLRYFFEEQRALRLMWEETAKRVDKVEHAVETLVGNIQEIYGQLEYIAGAIRDLSEALKLHGTAQEAAYKQVLARGKKKS